MSQASNTPGVPDTWNGPCPRCGAVAWGRWPHPDGEGCPQVIAYGEAEERRREELHRASVEAQNAMRDYYERAQMPILDMGEAMQAMTKALTDD